MIYMEQTICQCLHCANYQAGHSYPSSAASERSACRFSIHLTGSSITMSGSIGARLNMTRIGQLLVFWNGRVVFSTSNCLYQSIWAILSGTIRCSKRKDLSFNVLGKTLVEMVVFLSNVRMFISFYVARRAFGKYCRNN